MSNLVEVSGSCEVVVRRERAGEVTQLALLTRREGALIACRSEGELTQEIFDVAWHVSCVFVVSEHLLALQRLLCGPLGEGAESLVGALRILFSDAEVQFSDLLDLMDAAGIPYEYRALAPNAAIFRPRVAVA